MKHRFENVTPKEIEARSFQIIAGELPHPLEEELAPVIMRVIHTTADFDYADNLCFSPGAVGKGLDAIRRGACIVTDTNMGKAGINKAALHRHGGEVFCFMADEDVALAAAEHGTTRAAASMDKAAKIDRPLIFAIGNAPTALIRLRELMDAGAVRPELVIGVPVGFVNVVPAKELLMEADAPYIVARGRKGGSNVAAAICNALLYQLGRE